MIDYSNWKLSPRSEMLGVNSAYCEFGPSRPRCPEWINNVFGGAYKADKGEPQSGRRSNTFVDRRASAPGMRPQRLESAYFAGTPCEVEYADASTIEWVEAVGLDLFWISSRTEVRFTECWVADDLSLMFTYTNAGVRLGGRVGDLTSDNLGGGKMDPTHRNSANSTSTGHAFHTFYGIPIDVGSPRTEWVGTDGRRWWGDAPASGWVAAVYGNRLISIVTDGVLNRSH